MTANSERHSAFLVTARKESVSCELSQPMDQTEFSSTAKNRTNCPIDKKFLKRRDSSRLGIFLQIADSGFIWKRKKKKKKKNTHTSKI